MKIRDSLRRKLTVMNMLVSGGALLLASLAFFGYELFAFRTNLINNTSIQAQIIGLNAVSPLIFNDARSAESTLSALRASQHIVYAGIYGPDGTFFAGYWRKQPSQPLILPLFAGDRTDAFSVKRRRFDLAQRVIYQGKRVGSVYIESDLGALTDQFKNYGMILVAILATSLIAALLLSRIFQRSIAEPILKLAETARLVSRKKNYGIRATASGDQDEVATLVTAFNDMLTEIQNRDSALQESEQQFRTLADSIPQLAWMADANGDLDWYNRRWYEYTGTTSAEMLGWGWESVHDPAILPTVVETWKASIATGRRFEMTFPLRGYDGTFRDFLTIALPVRDAQGKVARWFGTNTDVTEQRRSEEALRQSEKLAATGRLAASIAHEINNPLESVTNLVYLARRQPANAQKYLTLADQELDRIAQITKNTLGFYRDTASPSKVNLSEALQEVTALYKRKLDFKNIRLTSEYGDEISLEGYPGEIRQIFANLMANAIEALPDSGSLRIRAKRTKAYGGDGVDGVRVTFLDNGVGITPEQMKRIFEPFYTTKKNVGTGLGLWLTLGLVGKHRGTLRVRSDTRPGKTWTAFSLFLPARGLETTPPPASSAIEEIV